MMSSNSTLEVHTYCPTFPVPNHFGLVETILIITGGILSTIAGIIICSTYLGVKELHKHPYSLIFRQTLFGCIASLTCLFGYSLLLSDLVMEESPCLVVVFWVSLGFSYFSLFLSYGFNALMSINLIYSIWKPFSDASSLSRFSWVIYLISCLSLMVTIFEIKVSNDDGTEPPFYYTLVTIMVLNLSLNLFALIFAGARVKTLGRAYDFQKKLIVQLSLYLGIFSFCYAVTLVDNILTALNPQMTTDLLKAITFFGITCNGFLNSIVWISSPYLRYCLKKRIWKATEGVPLLSYTAKDDFGMVHKIFRKNLLLCTLWGMREDIANLTDSYYVDSKNRKINQFVEMDVIKLSEHRVTPWTWERCDEVDDDLIVSNFTIISLCPYAFHNIRMRCGYPTHEYYKHLNPSTFVDYAMKHQKFSGGRSGSFFVYSPGKRLIIKTIPESEYRKMCQLMPYYYWHLMDNPHSLIVRILGCFEVQVFRSSLYVLVMENVFQGFNIQKIYDLKGSSIDRGGELPHTSKYGKDNDLRYPIDLNHEDAADLLTRIEIDTQLLANQNIMDYSLIVGIAKTLPDNYRKEFRGLLYQYGSPYKRTTDPQQRRWKKKRKRKKSSSEMDRKKKPDNMEGKRREEKEIEDKKQRREEGKSSDSTMRGKGTPSLSLSSLSLSFSFSLSFCLFSTLLSSLLSRSASTSCVSLFHSRSPSVLSD
eukprot:TRINITY_DN5526_c0_g1_i1.p1 TRINITY_DN5526_c0_g1~~TRINITY_DN5526_c0_g1_i1.p1  ORF type:complete len:704 (+),score=82.04 TRINITY_DN5526_c0_g1_i1:39-2150(+)